EYCNEDEHEVGRCVHSLSFASVYCVSAGLNYTVDGDDKVNKAYMSDDVMFMSYDVSKPPPLTNHQRRQGLTDDMPAVVGVRVLLHLFILISCDCLFRCRRQQRRRKCWPRLIINCKADVTRR